MTQDYEMEQYSQAFQEDTNSTHPYGKTSDLGQVV